MQPQNTSRGDELRSQTEGTKMATHEDPPELTDEVQWPIYEPPNDDLFRQQNRTLLRLHNSLPIGTWIPVGQFKTGVEDLLAFMKSRYVVTSDDSNWRYVVDCIADPSKLIPTKANLNGILRFVPGASHWTLLGARRLYVDFQDDADEFGFHVKCQGPRQLHSVEVLASYYRNENTRTQGPYRVSDWIPVSTESEPP